MKLLTKEIKRALPKLYETENISLNEKVVIAKFFLGHLTWYVIEGQEEEDGEFIFWGYVKNEADDFCSEFGYFSLQELESVRLAGIFPVERDLHFKKDKLVNLIDKEF